MPSLTVACYDLMQGMVDVPARPALLGGEAGRMQIWGRQEEEGRRGLCERRKLSLGCMMREE